MTEESDKPLRDLDDADLQDEATWDIERAEQLPPPERRARAVVSVAFPGETFELVSRAARSAGMKLSQFIREAAVEQATTPVPSFHLIVKPAETEGFSVALDPEEEGVLSMEPGERYGDGQIGIVA